MTEGRALSFKAIFIGFFVIANLLSALLQMLIQLIAETMLTAQGARAVLADSLAYQVFLLVWELIFIGLGGYAAARIAGREEMRHAKRVGVLTAGGGVIVVLVLAIFRPETSTMGYVFSIAGAIPAALVGGYIRAQARSVKAAIF